MLEVIGIIVLIQGVLGFVGPMFFDKDMGLLHLWFDLPPVAYLGIAVLGVVVTAAGRALRSSGPTS
ncbi:hypothetical protein CDO52_23945 [Nocardiopsis gilva YIM 90087]|uniref:Uncharacterized protein n=1 Tax=Nocardiopsis gilva YIM 90087 TaxID=1235441 RepID=A0A223SBI4_9ACTN|nr:hypothetical protein [Nocardiopsis gilva]ASU85446.1 hypothetical protein CDO52_23945 [Nocardiopsis gilva YIM 90087]